MRLLLMGVAGSLGVSASVNHHHPVQTADHINDASWQGAGHGAMRASHHQQDDGAGHRMTRGRWSKPEKDLALPAPTPAVDPRAAASRPAPGWVDGVVAAVFFAVAALAATGGIGGGGIFVPVLALALKFPAPTCIGLSQSLIFGASLGAFLNNALSHHPTVPDRPLIDLGLAAFLAPTEMAGAQLGMLLNHAVPTPIILLVMTILLSAITVTTLSKGWSQFEAERRARSGPGRSADEVERGRLIKSNEARRPPRLKPPPPPPPPPPPAEAIPTGFRGAFARALAASMSPAAEYTRGGSHMATDVGLLFGVWAGLMLLLLIRGGKGLRSMLGIAPCGREYWALTALGVTSLLLLSVLAGRRLVARCRQPPEDSEAGEGDQKHHPVAGDVSWRPAVAASALARTLLAGVIAGLMGVGGGIVLGPMMLELGMLPQVSSATTGTMVLLTSSCAAAGFVFSGVAPLDYSIAFGSVTMLGGYLGKRGFSHLVQKHGCASLIVLLLGGMIGVSMLAVAVTGILDLWRKLQAGAALADIFAFNGLCTP
jgi:uncharacterized membrane protein YfcA